MIRPGSDLKKKPEDVALGMPGVVAEQEVAQSGLADSCAAIQGY